MEISDWLEKLNLSEYAQRFAENDIDVDVLSELTDQDFDKLGVSLGHRRKMLRAIRTTPGGTASVTTHVSVVAEPQDRAERRQLTVVFCDLVGSTALSARLDPEDLREVITTYHRCCTELVERNGAQVVSLSPDDLLLWRICSSDVLSDFMEKTGGQGHRLMAAYAKLLQDPCCTATSKP